jgi:hypothetical protein
MTGIMHKYDMDHDAELNFGELKALMIDMVRNGDWVLRSK